METPQRVEVSYEDLIEGKIKLKTKNGKEITIKDLMGRLQKEVNGGPAIYLRETDIGKLNFVCSEIQKAEKEKILKLKGKGHRKEAEERTFFSKCRDQGSTVKAFVFWILQLYQVRSFEKGQGISARQFGKLADTSPSTLRKKLKNNFEIAKTKYIKENEFAIDIIKQTFNINRSIWACI